MTLTVCLQNLHEKNDICVDNSTLLLSFRQENRLLLLCLQVYSLHINKLEVWHGLCWILYINFA